MTVAAGKAIRAARGYWPLLALLPVAGVIHGVLVAVGDPWSPGEWASNIVFAYVVTLATVLLSRRQAKLQESVASMELIEKIASVTGALDDLSVRCHASTAQQILTDARAGLHLIRYADPPSRQEYLETIRAAVARLYDLATDSVRTYTRWNAEQ